MMKSLGSGIFSSTDNALPIDSVSFHLVRLCLSALLTSIYVTIKLVAEKWAAMGLS